jgi:ABC-type glycerol-3-phosphate transport system substrate-binding protein
MKLILAAIAVLAVLSCAACAQGGASSPGAGSGSITMYGTIDEGVTVRK